MENQPITKTQVLRKFICS